MGTAKATPQYRSETGVWRRWRALSATSLLEQKTLVAAEKLMDSMPGALLIVSPSLPD